MSHDRSRILFYIGDPDNDNAQIVIRDLTLDVSDTLVYNSLVVAKFSILCHINIGLHGKDATYISQAYISKRFYISNL